MPKKLPNRQPAPNITSITYWRKFAVHRVFYLFIASLFAISAVAYFGSPGGRGGSGPGGSERGAAAFAVVNGEPIPRGLYDSRWERQRQQAQMMRQYGGGQPTSPIQEVQQQGQILDQLIVNTILTGVAKKRGLTVSDAAIEKEIDNSYRNLGDGKKRSDDEIDSEMRKAGGSLDQLRTELREALLPKILAESIADKERVTEDDLLKTYDEVKVRRILFPIAGSPMASKGAKPDAQAKRDADDVLAKLKAGADFAKTADLYTKDPSNERTDLDPKTKKPVTRKQGGLMSNFGEQGWYKRGGGQPKEFEEAVFNVAKGEISDVVKTPEGYQIFKVEDSRRKLPDEYAKKKAELIQQEKMNRASKPIQELMDAERKAAKIQWSDPSLEWRYEFSKQGMMAGPDDKQQDAFLAKLREYTKKSPDDGAALLVLGQSLDRKAMMSSIKPSAAQPGEKEKLRNEAIAAYDKALSGPAEDQQIRFRLASLYHEAGKNDKAVEQLDKVMKQLSWDEDPNYIMAYQQLATEYKTLQQPEKEAAAKLKVAELTKKADEERKKNEAAQKAAAAKEAADKAAAAKAAADKNKTGAKTTPGGTINIAPPGPPSGAPVTSKTAPKKP